MWISTLSWAPEMAPLRLESLLERISPERRERVRESPRKDRMLQGVFAEVLLRLALAEQGGPVGRDVRLVRPEGGKPYLEGSPFRFSLTHCGNMAACALATEEVGLDLEAVRTEPKGVAARFFTAEENAELDAAAPVERDRLFFTLWTAKESYLKLTGKGLAGGLRTFSVSLLSGEPVLSAPSGPAAFYKRYVHGERHVLMACSPQSRFPERLLTWDMGNAVDTFLGLPA
jgi:4'-phosphopantetheinyl transferase